MPDLKDSLQLSAEYNMVVANITEPSNFLPHAEKTVGLGIQETLRCHVSQITFETS
jgi:hypothetical protein